MKNGVLKNTPQNYWFRTAKNEREFVILSCLVKQQMLIAKFESDEHSPEKENVLKIVTEALMLKWKWWNTPIKGAFYLVLNLIYLK